MKIRYQFNSSKAIQSLCYLVDKLGSVDKVKLMKLMYLAEREHFLAHGRPITGDRLSAMPHGPVPSACLEMVRGEWFPEPGFAFRYMHVDDNRITVRQSPGHGELTPTEVQVLDDVIESHGKTHAWALVDWTHTLPEYKKRYTVKGSSRPILYDDILEAAGGEHMRHGRPVVTTAMMEQMECPFPQSDPDL